MRSRPIPAPGRQDQQRDGHRGLDLGWRAYGAVSESIGRVDTKASIVLTLGSAVLGYVVVLSDSHRALTHLHGWRAVVEKVGLGTVALSVLLAAMVVLPHLTRARLNRRPVKGLVYFGELRQWAPENLCRRLDTLSVTEELAELADQLVINSRIAWFKHSLLQGALATMPIGVALILLSAIWP
jgi:hypothetical protein